MEDSRSHAAIIGVDIGTTSVKAVVSICDVNSVFISASSVSKIYKSSENHCASSKMPTTDLDSISQCEQGDCHFQSVHDIVLSIKNSFLELKEHYVKSVDIARVCKLAVCGQMHGVILWSKEYSNSRAVSRHDRWMGGLAIFKFTAMNLASARKIVSEALYCIRLSANSNSSTTFIRTMSSYKFKPADRLKGTDKNVWVTFTELARTTGAVNLGQGFPDYSPPQYIPQALAQSVAPDNFMINQYTRGFGHPRLVTAIANMYGKFHGREINPMTEILVTGGAYESLFCVFQGFINPGDEVIIIEPFFDCYQPMVTVAGGTPVFIPLRPCKKGEISSADWKLDPKELESKFSEKTKLIVLNTPNNPMGKVYTREELETIANLCKKYDVVCVADEVYEWMTYPGVEHIRIATLPGMWDRTVTISSAGKTFSATGWKLGWTIGPPSLIKALQLVHQNCLYTCCTPVQEAVARAFELEFERVNDKNSCYMYTLANDELLPKRDLMVQLLRQAGMMPTIPEGGYFIMADWSSLGISDEAIEDGSGDPKDFKFVKWLTKTHKLATIPPTAFYSKEHQHLAENFVRFCFFKKDETIDSAGKILKSFHK